jgi:hypothetical protein
VVHRYDSSKMVSGTPGFCEGRQIASFAPTLICCPAARLWTLEESAVYMSGSVRKIAGQLGFGRGLVHKILATVKRVAITNGAN